MQLAVQLEEQNTPVSLLSQANPEGYIIQPFIAPANLGAANAQAVGRID
jgi:hypothetical protein